MGTAGMLAVSVAMNFAFGSSFGRTVLESFAYGAAFGFADILKVAASHVVSNSIANRKWGAVTLGLLLWGTFTLCSAVSVVDCLRS
jgi:succinate-acetate transporter protein